VKVSASVPGRAAVEFGRLDGSLKDDHQLLEAIRPKP